ncbi:SRPBCC family protein [Nocardiopsis suaedae]|uniref:SRPBCC family protein n=1 Tax=Nocardiopsis suaedae TaxID=3018444 RepID=A0ABT4TT50_9ACTN|nr:SRPBCC family protein [Nocardiopsis suaedae]MDA2807853.1 SRPBCC family protein [Nocardiopsis suaedae]
MSRIELTTVLPVPADRVFRACADPHLHPLTMRRHRERVVHTSASGLFAQGDTVTFQARHFGIPWRLSARITRMDAPHSFVDEQVRGPFARLRHEHVFHRLEDRSCLMTDLVDFRSPLGPLGCLADALVLKEYMRLLIAERNANLLRLLEAGGSPQMVDTF